MTEYVTTRWYRAPEVLVGWHTYSCAVDVWAAGTVIAELVKRQPLFPGKDTIDQLELITHCLGKPPDHFINRCKKDEVRQYLRYLEPPDEITPMYVNLTLLFYYIGLLYLYVQIKHFKLYIA